MDALDGILRGAGALALGGAACCCWKFGRAVLSRCDSATASATLPANAFAGKVVWITGASSGIGRELAAQLARQGAKVILSARREETLNEVAQELQVLFPPGGAGETRVLALDLEDLGSLQEKVDKAISAFGCVDILFNNGGISSRALAREMKGLSLEAKMMSTNFLSHVQLAKALIPSMRERGGGRFVNISSVTGKVGVPLRTSYCGSKHAIMGYFDALRMEEVAFKSGIGVTNVCPGSVRTPLPYSALLADGSRLGTTDPNIEKGLDVGMTCERILAAVHCGIDEAWIAPRKELLFCYLGQYLPTLFKALGEKIALKIIAETMGQEWVNSRL